MRAQRFVTEALRCAFRGMSHRGICPGQWLSLAQIDSRQALQQDARPVS
jgi:hypothetical protein